MNRKIYIPNTVTSISYTAFKNSNIKTIVIDNFKSTIRPREDNWGAGSDAEVIYTNNYENMIYR